MRYRFGRHTLAEEAHELRRDDQPVELEPQTFTLLAHLIRNRHRVVTKHELHDVVWGDRFVSDSALTTQVKHCRRAVGDDGRAQSVIRTVHRVGYRFVAPVTELTADGTAPADRDDAGTAGATAAPADALDGGHDGVGDSERGRRGVGGDGDDRPPRTSRGVPVRSKPTYGRAAELDQLASRLRRHRLVTVTGPGGMGKSTLCTRLAESTPADGAVWWCELASARDAAAVPNVVLDAVGEAQQADADPVESVVRSLERRHGLLVLDDCEHVAQAAAAVAGNVARRCGSVRVLATSRAPLGVDGESVLPLGPLLPDDAAACFRARAHDAGATLAPDDPAVPELCRRLGGMPLALELAAARARLLAPAEMLELLDHRFRLLTAPSAPDDRHGSVSEVIAWSWDHLRPDDRDLLAGLSVFAGPFSWEDAAAIVRPDEDPVAVLDGLARLDRSALVVPDPGRDGAPRCRLLAPIREVAAARLADPGSVRRRHAAHVAGVAEHLDDEMQTERIDAALAAMGAAWGDLRAAVRTAAEDADRRTIWRIVRAVGGFADLRQSFEVLAWCDAAGGAAVGAPGTDHGAADRADVDRADVALAADAGAVQARLLAHRGQHRRARALAASAHDRHESHATLLSVVWCAYYAGDLDTVVDGAARLLDLSRSERGMDRAYAEGFAAIVGTVRQEADDGGPDVDPGRAGQGALGAFDCLVAGLRRCATDPERAATLLEAVVVASLRDDHRLLLGAAGSTLTQVALPARPPEEAARTLIRTLRAYRDRGMWTLISADVVMAARLLADGGDAATAARLLGARAASGYQVGLSEVLRAALEAELAERLGAERFGALAADGAGWSPPEAADVAIDALGSRLDRAS
ncbi:MAG TPA: winged helix-turn-helix domain-containing protein, partial [Acidimicrobiales bacterium]|nr:winged helix-turn-helix domain-containing protein [Acidimicrobiales bacterium]